MQYIYTIYSRMRTSAYQLLDFVIIHGPDVILLRVYIHTIAQGLTFLSTGAVLNREEDGTLVLIITAEDHGNPERTGSVTMTITLLDENDNPPTFVPQFGYSVLVPEDQEVGSVLLTVVSSALCCVLRCSCSTPSPPQAATDPDLLGGGLVSFRRATSSPLSKLSCFAVNRSGHMHMYCMTL